MDGRGASGRAEVIVPETMRRLIMDRNSTNSAIWGAIAGFGAGALTMYFLDPDTGARRRALVGDQLIKGRRKLNRAARITKEDLANRGRGMMIEAKNRLTDQEEAPDHVIEARVRSEMGHVLSNPHAVQVSSSGGNVRLTGSILARERATLLSCVNRVAGVNSVENLLSEHRTREELSVAHDREQRQAGTQGEDRTDPGRYQGIH